MKREISPLFRESWTAIASAGITGVLLCAVFAALTYVLPHESYALAADAFMAAQRPFASSPSAIMTEAGDMAALVAGLSSYALSRAAESSFGAYIGWQLALNAGTMLGFASLLAACSIPVGELKRIFFKLGGADGNFSDRPLLRWCIATAIVLPVALVGAGIAAEAYADEVVKTEPYTMAQGFIREQVSLAVYMYDGKRYDPRAVDALLATTSEESDRLSREACQTLEPLVNAAFDARVANVDSYLDWYYSLFADWEQLGSLITGSAEEFAAQKLEEKIEEGVDTSEFDALLERYLQQAEDLKAATLARLSEYEVTDDYPDWLVTEELPIEDGLSASIGPSERMRDATARLGASAATGVVAGFIAKKLVKKLIGKSFFKAGAGRIGGLLTAATIGSSGGPAGTLLGAAAGLATDIALQKADELMHREAYRQEIVDTIEAERAEALAAIGAM